MNNNNNNTKTYQFLAKLLIRVFFWVCKDLHASLNSTIKEAVPRLLSRPLPDTLTRNVTSKNVEMELTERRLISIGFEAPR
jgi:hypothetical protein